MLKITRKTWIKYLTKDLKKKRQISKKNILPEQ